jgi:hypothetical protein
MPKARLSTLLEVLPQNPEKYVKTNYEELKKKYGTRAVAVQGTRKSSGGGRIVAEGKSYETLVKLIEPPSFSNLEGEIVIGTVDEIFREKGHYMRWKDELRGGYNADLR